MFSSERFLSVLSPHTGLRVWYLLTREGRKGPFSSKANAQIALQDFISQRFKQGGSSRRSWISKD